MPAARNIETQTATADKATNETLNNVVSINRMRQLRQEIKLVADRSYQKRIISDKSYGEYHKLAMGKEDKEITLDLLKSIRDFAEVHESKAERIQKHIELAKRRKVASDNDEKFLMSHLILDNESRFNQDFQATENLILQKIKRMEDDKDAYEKIVNHKLVKNVGYLKIDKNTKIQIPDEKKFLEMTVPERRKFLKQIQEVMPKAEKHAEKAGEEESRESIDKYNGLLDKALGKKIIGKKTYEKFLDGFKKIDKDEKKYWIQEFPNEMKRYEKLWGSIRSTLQGKTLDHMESLRDEKGYTELFVEFGKAQENEQVRLGKEYDKELEKFEKEKIIGKHTVDEFKNWMSAKDLKDRYQAVEELNDGPGGQLERYRKLHNDIEKNLHKKAQVYMASKLDDWGYTEMKSQYDRFIKGEKVPDEKKTEDKNDPLSVVTSTSVKRAIIDTNIELKKKGKDKRRTFLNRIKTMFREEKRDDFDATGFQARLQKDRKEIVKNPQKIADAEKGADADVINLHERLKEKRIQKTRRHSTAIDRSGIEDEMRVLEKTKKAQVIDELGFKQVKTSSGADHNERKTQVEINREKGMERFFTEDHRQQFKNREQGGHDDLSLAVRTEGEQIVELDLREIRALEKYLEEEERKDMENEELDKAA